MQWKEEWVYVIRSALQEAIKWVEGMARKWCGYFPFVVCLVNVLVKPPKKKFNNHLIFITVTQEQFIN